MAKTAERDRPVEAEEIEVTPEMLAAGRLLLARFSYESDDEDEFLEKLYRRMTALSPPQ